MEIKKLFMVGVFFCCSILGCRVPMQHGYALEVDFDENNEPGALVCCTVCSFDGASENGANHEQLPCLERRSWITQEKCASTGTGTIGVSELNCQGYQKDNLLIMLGLSV